MHTASNIEAQLSTLHFKFIGQISRLHDEWMKTGGHHGQVLKRIQIVELPISMPAPQGPRVSLLGPYHSQKSSLFGSIHLIQTKEEAYQELDLRSPDESCLTRLSHHLCGERKPHSYVTLLRRYMLLSEAEAQSHGFCRCDVTPIDRLRMDAE